MDLPTTGTPQIPGTRREVITPIREVLGAMGREAMDRREVEVPTTKVSGRDLVRDQGELRE